ncbi:MAG: hypothetical protein FWC89_08925, partial [Defluviitaleaceae bacterium]|nr:hypothetical protein [Defluviitaleaceae bacterium]
MTTMATNFTNGNSLLAPTSAMHHDVTDDPFGLRFSANDSVSLNTGASNFRQNILSLPGRGGLGLNLDLVYTSAAAGLNAAGARGDILSHRNSFGLGLGWSFDLPRL